jgi:hypothetical protein
MSVDLWDRDKVIQHFNTCELVRATPSTTGRKTSIIFSLHPPKHAGVYVVYDCGVGGNKPHTPFYVGEARNLLQRLTMLFRCNSAKNPHPCQINYAIVTQKKISEIRCEDFCQRCRVKFISTDLLFGRIEIEEVLQREFGTNCDTFYKRFLDEPI